MEVYKEDAMVWKICLFIIIIFICWIYIDMQLGKKRHVEHIPPYIEPPIKMGDALFFSSGEIFFKHLLASIDMAENHIHMQFYIFRDDLIGTEVLNKLMIKAMEGVTVRLLVDFVGNKISKKMKKELKDAGVLFYRTNRPIFPFLFYRLNVRNHRKLTIIDGKYGYMGGFNIGDEYLGRDPEIGDWRDYHLFLTGEVVARIQSQFVKDWKEASGENLNVPSMKKTLFPPLPKGSLNIQIHSTNGAHVIEKLLTLMDKAKESILIGSPYFVPGKKMIDHLIRYSKRGVKITLLIPKYPDHPFVKDAAYPYLRKLMKAGANIRQFHAGFFHSKIVVVDDEIVDVGTANFDLRSFHLNYEVNCIVFDKEWTMKVKRIVERDFFELSEEMTLQDVYNRSIYERGKELFASVLSPLL